MLRATTALLFLLLASSTLVASEPYQPDAASVRRYGPAYRYPQAGWTVLHVEGEPFDRGYQHGRLMAKEISAYIRALSIQQSAKAPEDGWKLTRTLVSAAFLRKFDREYLEEMTGIADGASAAGAKFDGRPIDLIDIAAVNLVCEYDTLEHALIAQPTGLEGTRFPKASAAQPEPKPQKDHCSAFVATGPATADGKMVIGHITMSGLANANFSNVWLDVKPSKGHRVVMQSYPGGIQSMMDYYLNSAGLVVTETTISQTRFNPDGAPLASRIRKALQYSSTIDEVAKVLLEKNNGLYTNEWLIGDANTNEIAILELGTNSHKLRRSSKNEWLMPGVEGFYWGCNNTKDLQVRLDTYPGVTERPQDVSWRPSDRDKAWLRMYETHRGKIDANFGKIAFATPPLSAHPSLDAKVTTSDLAKKLESYALFGPPYGAVWTPTAQQNAHDSAIRTLVPNDWALLTTASPISSQIAKAADIGDTHSHAPAADPHTVPAWHGTLLAQSDSDLWITAGFAEFERVVALENALRARSGGKLSEADRERIDFALFRFRSNYHAAKAARPSWRGTPISSVNALTAELDRDRWHREQVALGVLMLSNLREAIGASAFASAMESFGHNNAGREVSANDFINFLAQQSGKDVKGMVEKWNSEPIGGDPVASTTYWLGDLENVVIVYGTRAETAANKAAATKLQEAVRVRWSNVTIPVIADSASTDENLKARHVVLIGRPTTNSLTERFRSAFPVTLHQNSATIGKEVYAHEETAVIAAGISPVDPRFSTVLLSGLSVDATYLAVDVVMNSRFSAEVLIAPAGGSTVPKIVRKQTPASKSVPIGSR